MSLQFYQKTKSKAILVLVGFLCLTSYSCKETQDSIVSDSTVVKVNLLGIANSDATNGLKAKSGGAVHQEEQVVNVPFSKSSSFHVTLTSNTSNPVGNGLRASSANRAAATIDRTALDENVKFTILVYAQDGSLAAEKTYTNGVDNQIGIPLKAGETYSFVTFSTNSTAATPDVKGRSSLSTATLEKIDSDLMYFSRKLTLVSGENNLDVILKHQFSQIITRVKINENTAGAITNITAPVITPSHIDANLKLADGKISYNGLNKEGVKIVFPALGSGVRQVESLPALLIHETETAGVLKFGSITIGDQTKTNVVIPDLSVIPGQRYYLNLDFSTCTQDVRGGGNMNWTYAEHIKDGKKGIMVNNVFMPNGKSLTKDFAAPGADYGFVFDIQEFDNSFNMVVNGVQLATSEIQFQSGNGGGAKQNIMFMDGSTHGGANTEIKNGKVAEVYNLKGTALKPLIKVVISAEGEVSMWGSKISGGPLYPLMLVNNVKFNKIQWKSGIGDANAVKVTQMIAGATKIIATGSGKRKTACNYL